jgi:hypothetical protein
VPVAPSENYRAELTRQRSLVRTQHLPLEEFRALQVATNRSRNSLAGKHS